MKMLSFGETDKIGAVIYVDTNQVLIEVEENEKISLLNVGSIVAIQTTRVFEFTIGIIEKVRRKANSLLQEDITEEYKEEMENDLYVSSDVIQVSLIGTYKTADGDKKINSKEELIHFHKLLITVIQYMGTT